MFSMIWLVLFFLFVQIHIDSSEEWTLDFEDNFDGPSVDLSTWTPTRDPIKNQLQYYNESNVYIEDGNLVFKTEYKPTIIDGTTYLYQSGIVTSKGLFSDTYGKWEISAKLPDPVFTRLHSAIWLQRQGPGCYQEIDIMGYYAGRKNHGVYNRVHGAYWFNHNNQSAACPAVLNAKGIYEYPYSPSKPLKNPPWVDCSDPNNPYQCGNGTFHETFHNFTLVWNGNQSLTWYINGLQVAYLNSSDGPMPYQPAYLIMNTAVCNESFCREKYGPLHYDKIGYMYIDYVRVYHKSSYPPAAKVISPNIISPIPPNDDVPPNKDMYPNHDNPPNQLQYIADIDMRHQNDIYPKDSNEEKEIKSLWIVIMICCIIIVSLLMIVAVLCTIFFLPSKQYVSINMDPDDPIDVEQKI